MIYYDRNYLDLTPNQARIILSSRFGARAPYPHFFALTEWQQKQIKIAVRDLGYRKQPKSNGSAAAWLYSELVEQAEKGVSKNPSRKRVKKNPTFGKKPGLKTGRSGRPDLTFKDAAKLAQKKVKANKRSFGRSMTFEEAAKLAISRVRAKRRVAKNPSARFLVRVETRPDAENQGPSYWLHPGGALLDRKAGAEKLTYLVARQKAVALTPRLPKKDRAEVWLERA